MMHRRENNSNEPRVPGAGPNWDVEAFESVVRDYQNAVASVAYAGTGDLAGSEDIAQETFLVAWQSKQALRDPRHIGGWLCGIARNLAKQWNRTRAAKKFAMARDDQARQMIDAGPSPVQRVITSEEQQTVWKSLEKIPGIYRETLVLFYRHSRSIADVAAALDISEENVRQRLSRGRSLLRDEVARTVEQTLEHSSPNSRFTATVMAGIESVSTFAKTAGGATAGSMAAKAAGSATGKIAAGSAAGVAGGLLGAAAGLGGAWLGTWLPAQLAPTMSERRLLEENGRRLLRVCILVTLGAFIGVLLLNWKGLLIPGIVFNVLLWVSFAIYITVHSIRINTQVREIRIHVRPEDDPNPSWVKERLSKPGNSPGTRLVGRKGTSRLRFLGWPLWDFQVSDPVFDFSNHHEQRHAQGWIAVGDRATGLLLAIGGRAIGLFAFGGLSIGVLSTGGLSIGLIGALGGLAIGGYQGIGGGAIGYNAIGGAAAGIHAAGGGALAVQDALGGAAISGNRAAGGFAIGTKTSISGADFSLPEKLAEAEQIRQNIPFASWLITEFGKPPRPGSWQLGLGIGLVCALALIFSQKIFYRRTLPEGEESQ